MPMKTADTHAMQNGSINEELFNECISCTSGASLIIDSFTEAHLINTILDNFISSPYTKWDIYIAVKIQLSLMNRSLYHYNSACISIKSLILSESWVDHGVRNGLNPQSVN